MPLSFFIGEHSNFEKLSSSEASMNNIAYDYRSLMHYGAYDFSSNGRPAIEPLDSRVPLSALGQRTSLSDQDLQHALNLYCGGQQQGKLHCTVCNVFPYMATN